MTDNPLMNVSDSDTLSADQLELLDYLLEDENSNSLAAAIVPRRQRSRTPLSFAQERLWILDQIEPGNTAFNIHGVFRLIGHLDVQALERSLNEIVRRHESLRTTFSFHEGQPIQVIASSAPAKFRMVDLTGLPEAERNSRAQTLIAEEVNGPFNLQEGPLFRISLIQIRAEEHILVLVVHHIVSDGWSMGILYRELSALYEAFSSGKASPLSDLPIQYADYADWQRKRLKGEVLEAQLSYWRRQLSGAPPALELPMDYPRPPIQTFRGASEKLELSNDLHLKLKSLSLKNGATLFMTLLAAFKIHLHRYTGQNDIVVGSPIAGRNRSETEGLIGFFLNNLVLRTDLSGRPTFRDVVSRVREVALGAYAHQDIPFEKLLGELHPERDPSRTPFFHVYFNMLSQDDSKPSFENLTTERFGQAEPKSKFDLTLYVRDQRSGLFFNLVYNADIFQQSRIAEMLKQFEQLLWHVVDHPDHRIDSYSLVTTHARKVLPDPAMSLNDEWRGAIHERCALHAKTIPQQLAVIDQWDSWSYALLNSCSNQVAHYFLHQGIKPEEIIAIYGHRSAALVCAVLGILKAGSAFLILDPAYPATRHKDCLQQAQPRAWLELEAAGTVSPELAAYIDTLPLRCRSSLSKSVASIHDAFNDYPDDDPQISTSAENLAYVSFTSGSTGRPKGVLGRHGPLSHFLPWQERTFGLSASDRYTMLSGLSHDPLQRDMFTPLWFGASLFIPDPDIIGTANLARWMKEQKITFTHLVPSMLQLLTETAAADCDLPSLRYAYFVGEKLTPRDIARLRRLAPQVNCIAAYGTTETQRAVSYYFISKDETVDADDGKAAYPLGRGTDDVQLLVLNSEQRLAGVSELGEIYLRSPHLARGYLGDEDLTQSRFLKNPYTDIAGDRLYRTGDLGRYLADGNVEFSGRADRQIKLRGFRIEPREIEASLAQHHSIKEVVVIARNGVTDGPDTQGPGTHLVAYVVPTQEQIVTVSELRDFLNQRLPNYMLPSAFVLLPALPLTPNGKLDRRALPVPDGSRPELKEVFVTPGTPAEKKIAEIWGEVLSINEVSLRDNFFELGGHSLLAIKLISELRKQFQIAIPVRLLFEAPTIAQLAVRLERRTKRVVSLNEKVNYSHLVELHTGPNRRPIFCFPYTCGVQGEYTPFLMLARYMGSDYSFYGLQAKADSDKPSHTTIEELATKYVREIEDFEPNGPYYLIGDCAGGSEAYETARQLWMRGKKVGLLVLFDARGPYLPGQYWRIGPYSVKDLDRVRGRLLSSRRTWCRNLMARINFHLEEIKNLPKIERWRYFITKALAKALKGAKTQLGKSQVGSSVPCQEPEVALIASEEQLLEDVRRARRHYKSNWPRNYGGRLAVFVNEQWFGFDRTFGWAGMAAGGVETHVIPGEHNSYMREHVSLVVDQLRACLEKARKET